MAEKMYQCSCVSSIFYREQTNLSAFKAIHSKTVLFYDPTVSYRLTPGETSLQFVRFLRWFSNCSRWQHFTTNSTLEKINGVHCTVQLKRKINLRTLKILVFIQYYDIVIYIYY